MKIQTIKNKYCEVSVKEVGAELCSFKSLASGKEYVWQADPEVWASHAPNLFPVIGCLKDDWIILKMTGKSQDVVTKKKHPMDTHLHGLSGCGLWLMMPRVNENACDYKLIGS